MTSFVYILTNEYNNVLYIGVTHDLCKRIEQHRVGHNRSFTTRYRVHKLVYVEEYFDIRIAIQREKQLKHWNRLWKVDLIEKSNPTWNDLSIEL